jgi:hypothetical protein
MRMLASLASLGLSRTASETDGTRIKLFNFNGLMDLSALAQNSRANTPEQIPGLRESVASVGDMIAR